MRFVTDLDLPDLACPDEAAVHAAHMAPWRHAGSPLFAELVEARGASWLGVPAQPLVVVTTAPILAEDVPA